ncbi:ABC transporter ATP-binding protein [Hymenobacter terrestris]|uniref:ABC transporter ATP-binding protein n=1 Tax=Hymenobacter terrestris TaxID=2748310 RepID=A0ABX2Q673_9BACT|nr:ABC transporter ATP-binding protein [Hymenobacter terrestris]NVO85916.1 ABC transporter ATP-binding protein [Hymenobacter terrestris]
MSNIAIRVENLGKLYRLGEIGTGTLSHDLNRAWARLRGKEDPFAKIGETNDRATKGSSDYVWSLKDVSFDVKQGEVLGIIGRNGAGKSTLLKILSKVTAPTTGRIKVKGRIASLLEVGTGFHPELTGRENIFLNGAILGMTKAEIRSKFDEIVDFSGVERYIDTPVKRYSSGMYVRLAFAVAAFLEPEILIVDEVLAVGDAEFQKKCLGRMKHVSVNDGRTVLFVSHNMEALNRLCDRSVLLAQGRVEKIADTDTIIGSYVQKNFGSRGTMSWSDDNDSPGNDIIRLLSVSIINEGHDIVERIDIKRKIGISFTYKVLKPGQRFTHGVNIYNHHGVHLISSHDVEQANKQIAVATGVYTTTVWIPGDLLAEGLLTVGVAIMKYEPFEVWLHEENAVSFTVIDPITGDSARGYYTGSFPGVVRPLLQWDAVVEE